MPENIKIPSVFKIYDKYYLGELTIKKKDKHEGTLYIQTEIETDKGKKKIDLSYVDIVGPIIFRMEDKK